MRPSAMAAALLGTLACARPMVPASSQERTSEDDRATARAEEQRAEELEQSLSALSAGERPPDCSRMCELIGEICELSGRICAISARHRDDAELAGRCAASQQRCLRSRDRVPPGCSCGARAGPDR
jgi:hypothetical protein